MKRVILFMSLLVISMSCVLDARNYKISVLGDSYSTYEGYVYPDTNVVWYGPSLKRENDVAKVEQTWWWLLTHKKGYELEKNNSYSGTTISNTGYFKSDASASSFTARMTDLGQPDIILVFGGTNDSWAGSPIGENKYSDWTKEDLYRVRPAFCYLLEGLKKAYPKAKIFNITNSELSKDFDKAATEICEHYGIYNIELVHIDKQEGHPSINGMKQICDQVLAVLKKHKL